MVVVVFFVWVRTGFISKYSSLYLRVCITVPSILNIFTISLSAIQLHKLFGIHCIWTKIWEKSWFAPRLSVEFWKAPLPPPHQPFPALGWPLWQLWLCFTAPDPNVFRATSKYQNHSFSENWSSRACALWDRCVGFSKLKYFFSWKWKHHFFANLHFKRLEAKNIHVK